MALLECTSSPPSFLALPTEMHAAVSSHLEFLDLHSLRLTCHYFHSLTSPPTHGELLAVETTTLGFLACVGCTRLRPAATFTANMVKRKKARGGGQAHNRFCIECGRRPLPGLHRYTPGHRWEEHGVPFVRCLSCRSIAEGPQDKAAKLCVSCLGQAVRRARAVRERQMVWREVAEQKERKLLRAERRQNWIDSGRAMSDFSSQDPSEQGSRDAWDWGQDDDMNYSAYS